MNILKCDTEAFNMNYKIYTIYTIDYIQKEPKKLKLDCTFEKQTLF